jgi:hypothetical protein
VNKIQADEIMLERCIERMMMRGGCCKHGMVGSEENLDEGMFSIGFTLQLPEGRRGELFPFSLKHIHQRGYVTL